MNKTTHFAVRISQEQRDALERACEDVGIDAATITRALLSAFIEQVREKGTIQLPLKVVPRNRKNTNPYVAESLTLMWKQMLQQTDMEALNELIWKTQEGDEKSEKEVRKIFRNGAKAALGEAVPGMDPNDFADKWVESMKEGPKRPFKIIWDEVEARKKQKK